MDTIQGHAVAGIDAEVKADARARVGDDLVVEGEVALTWEDRQAGGEGERIGSERDVASTSCKNRNGVAIRASIPKTWSIDRESTGTGAPGFNNVVFGVDGDDIASDQRA